MDQCLVDHAVVSVPLTRSSVKIEDRCLSFTSKELMAQEFLEQRVIAEPFSAIVEARDKEVETLELFQRSLPLLFRLA
jgi:hypothetical protein